MNRLKPTRIAKEMRREELAALAGCSYQHVRILEGNTPPTPRLDLARRIVRALGSSLDKVFPEQRS